MKMSEICIEKVANGYVIECKYKPQRKAMRSGGDYPLGYSENKVEHVAISESDALKKVKELIGKLSGGMEDSDG